MRVAILVCIGFCFLLPACTKNDSAPQKQDITYASVAYGPDSAQVMDVYVPGNVKKTIVPVFLLLHGGGWFSGDKSNFDGLGIYDTLMHSGFAVANMNYRLVPKALYPTTLDDIDSAIATLIKNQKVWGIDPSHICIVGRSSGSQLALMYAYTRNNEHRIKAAIDFFGITDLTARQDMASRLDTQIANFLGYKYIDNKHLWHDASPLYHVSNAVPTAIFHGNIDDVVYLTQSQWLRDSLQQRGYPYSYLVWEGFSHGFDSTTYKASFTIAINWLNSYIYAGN